ncbi:hypothetical protein [Flavobacterium beibuense]|uniref:hypothetical protein n=1 Tax=Flavobacterium beibuense TaxID=657326 RepID=UPI003A90B1AC
MLRENTHQDLLHDDLMSIVEPLISSGVSLTDFQLILSEMYSNSVSNAPADETDNFTAKRQTPVFLALIEFIGNLQKSQL